MSLRSFIDKIKPNFEKGGKYAKLQSTFDAFESFLYVPKKVTTHGSQIRDAVDLKRIMSVVIIALVPALLFGMWNVGFQHARSLGQVDTWTFWQMFGFGALKVMPIVVVSYVVGLGIEFIAAQMRGHEVNEGFLVSGMLIPLIMPVDAPLWMVAVSTAFAVIFGKEVFGGTGMNIFNPALLARAFMFFAYPSKISGDFVWIAGLTGGDGVVDGFSGATPLAIAKSNLVDKLPSAYDMFMGYIPGSIGETSTLAILIGAAILIFTGIGNWKIMLSVFAGGAVMGLIFNVIGINPYMELPFYYHFIMGGFAFGAVFMATDPVTAAQTERGKWIYGFLVGLMAVLIRVFNPAYPEGMMLSILLLNTFAPLIDHFVVESNIKRRLKRAKVKA
ncbi:NADH:ubiquinone reductase (Na(+)-transporting) subunit B [Acetobacteroides hydrogenigenes]|uniref:Na(+)-translocating NADH-quinone reductase subunit B n=1 Tax=Acetobacteroides hydrogenigenes TaxID=979970 RepID=A0A4R2F152_9BACT|nr:NADH:ubiquinone reductase (Na(+)-transporting) subunit B [Acetobacteroides hydrogenigenes]TCN70699.1 Na+-transporting NADH:ubiquinone oxidoreductase subunit B [Acetobacteroides hydrogenigenes]